MIQSEVVIHVRMPNYAKHAFLPEELRTQKSFRHRKPVQVSPSIQLSRLLLATTHFVVAKVGGDGFSHVCKKLAFSFGAPSWLNKVRTDSRGIIWTRRGPYAWKTRYPRPHRNHTHYTSDVTELAVVVCMQYVRAVPR